MHQGVQVNEINNEPLRIIETAIKYFPDSDSHFYEAQDQYGRWWFYNRGGRYGSFDEAEEIEAEERRKGIISPDLYYFDDDRIVEKIKRQEEVLYVYWVNRGWECGDNCIDPDRGGYIEVVTKDGLLYAHDRIFYDYTKLKEFGFKIKTKGIINLEFWGCVGNYQWEGGNELEEKNEYHEEYHEDSHEWSSQDIYNSLGGEDGERKYMSDGAWISPDGTITFDR